MGGVHGESATVQPSNRGSSAPPSAPTDASSTASPAFAQRSPFYAVAHSAKAATTSLQSLLAVVGRLEEAFRSSGDAVLRSANFPSNPETRELQNAASSPSSTDLLLATLDSLASATTRGDAEVGQQLTSLRRGVATLTQELHSLLERCPNLQSSTATTTTGPSAAVQGLIAHGTQSPTPLNSVRTGGGVAARLPVGEHSSSAAAPAASDSTQGSPRPSVVVTPTTSPQLLPGSFASRRGNGSGLGDALRSPSSMTSSVSPTPARATTRATDSANTPGALTPAARPLPSSPNRTATAAMQLSSAASLSPQLFAHPVDRSDFTQLPVSLFPSAACAESVKRYLSNCVEWPPRPRKHNVRLLTPRRHWRDDRAGGGAKAVCVSTDSGSDMGRGPWGDVEEDAEEDGFHTPATTASRPEQDGDNGCRAASLAVSQHRSRDDTDEFLRRLMEDSPYDMSMLRAGSRSSDSNSNAYHSGDSSSSAGVEEDQQQPLSATGAAEQYHGGVGIDAGTGAKGKRMRSHHTCETDCSATQVKKSLRRGRPTVMESVDALVLAQLRADGVCLSDAMVCELRGCAPAAGNCGSCTTSDGRAKAAKTQELLSAQAAERRGAESCDEMVPMAAVSTTQRSRHVRQAAVKDSGAVDFADVLQEVRGFVRHAQRSVGPFDDLPAASANFPSAPLTRPRVLDVPAGLSPSALQSPLLPTTAAWFDQIHDFCSLLDGTALCPSRDRSDEEEERSDADDAAAKNSDGRGTRRSYTTTTTATRERVPLHDDSRHSTCASGRLSSTTSSNTATAASENNFSLADEFFTSAEEAEDGENDEEEDNAQQQQPLQRPALPSGASDVSSRRHSSPSRITGTASHTQQPLAMSASSADEPSVHSSTNNNTYFAQGSFSTLSTTAPLNAPSAEAEAAEAAEVERGGPAQETTPIRPGQSNVATSGDFWLERGDVPLNATPSSARLGLQTPGNVGLRSGRGLERDTSRGAAAAGDEGRAEAGRRSSPFTRMSHSSTINVPAAHTLEQRNHRRERQRHRNFQEERLAFLRDRYWHQLGSNTEEWASSACRLPHVAGKVKLSKRKEEKILEGGVLKRPGNAAGGDTPFFNCRAAAQELRALSALMRTDLTLLTTLQELSRLLTEAAARTSTAAVTPPVLLATRSPPLKDQLANLQWSESLSAATELLLSVQEQQIMQTRIQNELNLRGTTRGDYESASVAPALSAASSATPSSTMISLLLSSLHPVSALGYAPLLAQFLSTSSHRHGAAEEEVQAQENEGRVARFVAAVTPYLLAWRSRPATGAVPTLNTTTPFSLLLPVWAYVEAVTTELLEEARKLNALYELFAQLATEAAAAMETTGGRFSRSGVDDRLLSHVRHGGRAISVFTNAGVAGTRLSMDNGLEKFITPVSRHLLRSFDRLETRHLLPNVFPDVHLSDVVARRRAQRLQLRQQQPPLSPSPSLSARTPPPRLSIAHRRLSGRATEGHGGAATAAADEDEALDSFALPSGNSPSSQARRNAVGAQSSMRDGEQQRQQQSARSSGTPVRPPSEANNRNSSNENADDGRNNEEEESRRRDDNAATPNARRGSTSRRTNRSSTASSEPRHVIIEGFVRYLTGGMDRLRGSSGRGSRTGEEESHGGSEGGNSPSLKSQQPSVQQHHSPSGLTLDVPHTSSLLKEQDGRLEKATSNFALIRAVSGDLLTQTVVGDVQGGLRAVTELQVADLSRRHYFNSQAAAFTMQLAPSSLSTALGSNLDSVPFTSVVQCRWQPVFQSTMCFCPVTRRRCLDPLVCGALVVCSPLLPEEIIYCSPEESSPPSNHNTTHVSPRGGAPPSPSGSSPLPFPATIRALRNGLGRAMAVRALGGGRPTPGPSVRRAEAAREAAVSLPLPSVIATTQTATTGSSPLLPGQPAAGAAPVGRVAILPARAELLPPHFPAFFLRQTPMLPERVVLPRILTQIPTTLYADSSAVAGGSEQGNGEAEEEENEGISPEGEVVLPEAARRVLQAVTLLMEAPPITRNLLLSPDVSQTRWLNPPTLLECGHVVAHKTYLDLRTSARRTSRTAAVPPATVVCCPYCSKITPVKDALTLSYLY
ncbi:hypothetical protein ABL78_4950 [Leptomonas seymouri]|uniref:Uncharacterized protein n=1 Tax=Leptomonas seymouri TaxID=5684 RepID=A0A0N1I457_LEPSE|nr:hypothetical protein ABL78_4950 [Leptomonas seymouri]|eukprot:KPI85988.1 hypothetical protein ABL78_4950 [Leptomonas seymouri]